MLYLRLSLVSWVDLYLLLLILLRCHSHSLFNATYNICPFLNESTITTKCLLLPNSHSNQSFPPAPAYITDLMYLHSRTWKKEELILRRKEGRKEGRKKEFKKSKRTAAMTAELGNYMAEVGRPAFMLLHLHYLVLRQLGILVRRGYSQFIS